MDDLNSQFGQLSTTAKEFRPQSDLQASAVKEFVPGQGWSATASAPRPESENPSMPSNTSGLYAQPQHPVDVSAPSQPGASPMPAFRNLYSLALNEDLWRYFREISLENDRQMDPSDPKHKAIPLPYCNGFYLDVSQRVRSSTFGYPSMTFQVTSREDGHLYCLRRFDNVRSVSSKIAATVLDVWSQRSVQEHPGIVPLYQCFLAQRALFFVHQYIPGCRSLKDQLTGPLSEPIIWSCIVQLVSAIAAVHRAKLAVRSLRLQHILCNMDSTGSKLRVRIGAAGIVDALEFEARKPIDGLQREDIRDLGLIIVSLATGTEVTRDTDPETFAKCESFLAQNFSRELHSLAVTLVRSNQRPPTIFSIQQAVAQKAFEEQDNAYRTADRFEHALANEYESGRGLRLMMKLGFVNERPELGPNRRWAQSGDCYILSLFRDYVFHQADGAGYPVMDLGHIVSCLNKLDAASEEKIVLASRDAKSLMIVSFADVARCLESAYQELCSCAVHPSSVIH